MIDPLSLIPLGGHLVVKRKPLPTHDGEFELVKTARRVRVCPQCRGLGCMVYRKMEEDGIKIAKHIELECMRCNGSGKLYGGSIDPRKRYREFVAEVLAVGPGRPKAKIRLADQRVRYWREGRHPIPVKVGDRVVLAKWAGDNRGAWSWELDDEHLLIKDYEVLALLKDSGDPQALPRVPAESNSPEVDPA